MFPIILRMGPLRRIIWVESFKDATDLGAVAGLWAREYQRTIGYGPHYMLYAGDYDVYVAQVSAMSDILNP